MRLPICQSSGVPSVAEYWHIDDTTNDIPAKATMLACKHAAMVGGGTEFASTYAAYDNLPGYAAPLFVRIVESLETTSTFKSRKVDLRKQGYGPDVKDPLYVLKGRDEGYVPYYDDYPQQVADGKLPKG